MFGENNDRKIIQRRQLNVGVPYMGIFLQLDAGERQINYMNTVIKDWTMQFEKSYLPEWLNIKAMMNWVTRTLIYPLIVTCLSDAQCRELETKQYHTSLSKCGIVSKIRTKFRYLSRQYQGLKLPQLSTSQGIAHLNR